jgi:hypothetical protein
MAAVAHDCCVDGRRHDVGAQLQALQMARTLKPASRGIRGATPARELVGVAGG